MSLRSIFGATVPDAREVPSVPMLDRPREDGSGKVVLRRLSAVLLSPYPLKPPARACGLSEQSIELWCKAALGQCGLSVLESPADLAYPNTGVLLVNVATATPPAGEIHALNVDMSLSQFVGLRDHPECAGLAPVYRPQSYLTMVTSEELPTRARELLTTQLNEFIAAWRVANAR